MRSFFSFPDPVNETLARLVAAGLVAQAVLFLLFREGWLLVPLTYGFAARVVTGPTMSPLGRFVTRVASPFIERCGSVTSRRVPGPPKRFAQVIELSFTGGASIAWWLDAPVVTNTVLGGLIVAASLEAVFAVYLGCIAYSAIWGCADCDEISELLQQAIVRARREVGDDVSDNAHIAV